MVLWRPNISKGCQSLLPLKNLRISSCQVQASDSDDDTVDSDVESGRHRRPMTKRKTEPSLVDHQKSNSPSIESSQKEQKAWKHMENIWKTIQIGFTNSPGFYTFPGRTSKRIISSLGQWNLPPSAKTMQAASQKLVHCGGFVRCWNSVICLLKMFNFKMEQSNLFSTSPQVIVLPIHLGHISREPIFQSFAQGTTRLSENHRQSCPRFTHDWSFPIQISDKLVYP